MLNYVKQLIDETPEDLLKEPNTSVVANHLFNLNNNAQKLELSIAILYYHLMTQL